MRNFGPINPHGTAFAPKQWLYQKEATGIESSKCIVLVHADTVVTCAWPQTTRCKVQNGNMRNFGPINPHGTVFARKQWLQKKKATDMES